MGLSIGPESFTDASYTAALAQRTALSAQARTTSIEWSFGIVGVLLAAAVAISNQRTILPSLVSLVAVAITIPLASLAVSNESTLRGLAVVSAHLTCARFHEVLLKSVDAGTFEKHLARVAVQIDLLGARVQTKASLYTDVLLMGPGYLFVGASAVFGYSWYTYWTNSGTLTTIPAVAVAILAPALLIVVLCWMVWTTRLTSKVANLTEMPECPVCRTQGEVGKLLQDGHVPTGFEKQPDHIEPRSLPRADSVTGGDPAQSRTGVSLPLEEGPHSGRFGS